MEQLLFWINTRSIPVTKTWHIFRFANIHSFKGKIRKCTESQKMEEESLYDWLEPEKEKTAKKERYKSKHDPNPLLVSSSFCPKNVSNEPVRKIKIKTKPPVPKRSDAPPAATTTKKNFVMANAIQAILSNSTSVDSRNKKPYRYTNKKTYGKVPEYLRKIKSQREEEERTLLRIQEEENKKQMLAQGNLPESLMPEESRLELLQKLKLKWDENNRLYQKQAHVIILDTQGKVKRKEILERKLKDIETAIRRLEKGPVTIVHQE